MRILRRSCSRRQSRVVPDGSFQLAGELCPQAERIGFLWQIRSVLRYGRRPVGTLQCIATLSSRVPHFVDRVTWWSKPDGPAASPSELRLDWDCVGGPFTGGQPGSSKRIDQQGWSTTRPKWTLHHGRPSTMVRCVLIRLTDGAVGVA